MLVVMMVVMMVVVVVVRVSLKRQNIFLQPGDITPTVSRYEDNKKTISNV